MIYVNGWTIQKGKGSSKTLVSRGFAGTGFPRYGAEIRNFHGLTVFKRQRCFGAGGFDTGSRTNA
jgi:hypothetical protein